MWKLEVETDGKSKDILHTLGKLLKPISIT